MSLHPIRFSHSPIWRDQKKYYDQKGIDAWDEDVPFYITSNPFIAKEYAHIALRFMQDYMRNNATASKNPFYIFELGAGTGQFSFYFLKNLLTLQKILQLEHIQVRYVMSDVTDASFDFWKNHHALKPFVDAGILHFVTYDLYQENKLPFAIKNPLILIANYLFDSIASDVFTVSDGKLYEALVTIHADDIKDIKIDYTPNEIAQKYYGNEFDDILFEYPKLLMDTHFQFPIASLHALKNLQKLCNNQFLLITSDKGYTNTEELDHCDYPELDFHGSFSVMVNYHAIGAFMKKSGGDYRIQAFRENIVTGVFTSALTLQKFPETNLAIQHMIGEFSPTDYFLMYEYFNEHFKKCSLEVISSYLNLSNWDPAVFETVAEHLADSAAEGDAEVILFLCEHLHLIAENFYYLPSSADVLFDIGLFFQNASRFEKAIHYYDLSEQFFKKNDVTLFNKGLCLHQLNRDAQAIACLEAALALNPTADDVKNWIDMIKQH